MLCYMSQSLDAVCNEANKYKALTKQKLSKDCAFFFYKPNMQLIWLVLTRLFLAPLLWVRSANGPQAKQHSQRYLILVAITDNEL